MRVEGFAKEFGGGGTVAVRLIKKKDLTQRALRSEHRGRREQ
jgi:hypothetical protein